MLVQEQINRGLDLLIELGDSIDSLNFGGCLYAAWGVHQVLRREGIDCEDVVIVQFDNGWTGVESNKAFIQGENDTATSSSHFGVSFDGGENVYDSNGHIPHKRFKEKLVIPYSITDKFCQNSLKYGRWNSDFCREHDLSILNSILGLQLEA